MLKDALAPQRLLVAGGIFSFGRHWAYSGYMTVFSYTTIQAPSEGNYKEKGSKFLAFAYPVSTEEKIKDHLKALKKKYFDARHHGYAYILGTGGETYRAFDDGEPNHSTGDPILGQIRSRKLTNVLVVVFRYFGGTKLGVGDSSAPTARPLAMPLLMQCPLNAKLSRHWKSPSNFPPRPRS